MAVARSRTVRLVDDLPPEPVDGGPIEVVIDDGDEGDTKVEYDKDKNIKTITHPDGSITIDTNPDLSEDKRDKNDFYDNMASDLQDGELTKIAGDLLDGIQADEDSRREWLSTRERGIALLGLKLEEPRGDTGASSAPLEGMSTVRHPLLLEATIRFQATARGELLPAAGPVKVRNDRTSAPAPDPQNPQVHTDNARLEDLAQALEKDMNHYLTVTASEYVPDTDRMLFYVGFGGDGFKKVYNCPLRRRPVSESVNAEDIIVSNAATDMRNCGRVTHKIRMRQSTMRRMQILGAYRDVKLDRPTPSQPNQVEQKKADIAGVKPEPQRTEDQDYEVYETYCELDIDEFAPEQFKGKGLPLPYKVTLEKQSRQVLEIRRNWEEEDEQALPKQFFVQYPFIRGLGFYGLGFIHILGNTTTTLTAIWREFVDLGMFANFPGFLFAKGAGRQNTNQIRVPPGGGMAMDIPPGMPINQAIMPIPYKDLGPAFTAFASHVEEVGQRLGQTADVAVGEGKADTPVGTIMAVIEQATKVMDSVHKRLHQAQTEEFQLLADRFREDPEAFWRHNKRPTMEWQKEQFIEALDKWELVPVADPNNPTSLHRIAKAVAILQLAQNYQQFFNIKEVLARIFRIVGIDPEGLFLPQMASPPPDPRVMAIQQKAETERVKSQIQWLQTQIQQAETMAKIADSAKERESREKIERMKIMESQLKLHQEYIIHAHELRNSNEAAANEQHSERIKTAHDLAMSIAQHHGETELSSKSHDHELQTDRERHQHDLQKERERHDQEQRHTQEAHEANLQNTREIGKAKAAAARAMPKKGPSK